MEKGRKRRKKFMNKIEKLTVELVQLNAQIKELTEAKKEEEEPFRKALKEIAETYEPMLGPLSKRDALLRQEVISLYSGEPKVEVEGVGSIVFPETYNFEVQDIKKVPVEYLMVDAAKVREDIRKGVRKIKGLTIAKRFWNGLRVCMWKEPQEE